MFHVTFPGLGLAFDINRVAFTVGSLPVYWYGICIATGMLLGLLFAIKQSKRFGVNDDRMLDVVFVATICAVISARVYYVVFAPFKFESLWDMINLRDGGIAIYGAVIGAALSGILLCKWRNVPVLPMLDLASLGFLIGQACGRWGNFFNQEAFGSNTTMPWGMYSEGTHAYLSGSTVTAPAGVVIDPNMPVHPTFFYESVWCLLGFFLLWSYIKRRKFNGEIGLMYVMWYGVERFYVEGLRTDSLMTGFFDLRVSQIVALTSVAIALVVWLFMRRCVKQSGEVLKVVYPVTPKELGVAGAGATVLTWGVQEVPPTNAQIKEKIAAMRALLTEQPAQEPDPNVALETEETSETESEEANDGDAD